MARSGRSGACSPVRCRSRRSSFGHSGINRHDQRQRCRQDRVPCSIEPAARSTQNDGAVRDEDVVEDDRVRAGGAHTEAAPVIGERYAGCGERERQSGQPAGLPQDRRTAPMSPGAHPLATRWRGLPGANPKAAVGERRGVPFDSSQSFAPVETSTISSAATRSSRSCPGRSWR